MKPSSQYRRKQPETLRIRALTPSLTVADLQKSVEWYRDIVGFYVKESHEHEGVVVGYTLMAGEQRILINQDDGAKGTDRVKGTGTRMYLETIQDVDILAAAIKRRGGKLASEPEDTPWGARAFNLVDPDGFALTIMSPA